MRIAILPPPVTGSYLTRTFHSSVNALLLVILVSACATTQPAATEIKQRAQARWDALLSGDYDTAYSFYSPGYRSSHTRTDFEIAMRSKRVGWISSEVQESSCQADVCTVVALVGYQVVGAVPGVSKFHSKAKVNERWVHTEGQWWFLPDD